VTPQPRPQRLQTLVGAIAYVDSGWSDLEWQAIAATMKRCAGGDVAPLEDAVAPALSHRATLERAVCAALTSVIDRRGPITKSTAAAAARHVVGQVAEMRVAAPPSE